VSRKAGERESAYKREAAERHGRVVHWAESTTERGKGCGKPVRGKVCEREGKHLRGKAYQSGREKAHERSELCVRETQAKQARDRGKPCVRKAKQVKEANRVRHGSRKVREGEKESNMEEIDV